MLSCGGLEASGAVVGSKARETFSLIVDNRVLSLTT